MTTGKRLPLLLFSFAAAVNVMLLAQAFASVATYELIVDNTWNHETHADAYRGIVQPHLSHLGGGSHNADVSIWEPGGFSSPGMVRMQETGWTDVLAEEIRAAISDGSAHSVYQFEQWFGAPSTTTLRIEVPSTHPLVSLVTMMGPSPDWFVGVSGLDLMGSHGWKDNVEVDLFPYDGGTRSSHEFALFGPLTDPVEPISLIDSPPLRHRSLGTFTFNLLNVSGLSLQAGDADLDFDFDQLDVVQVQKAGKYLTGQVATWREGDWNGAPGNDAANPPAGDGVFDQLDIMAALNTASYLSGPYAAVRPGGTEGDSQTSIGYNANTGEVDLIYVPVPEPATIALLVLGLLAMPMCRARRFDATKDS